MRIVLDTNVLIGALITHGTPPDQLYRAWRRGELELVTCPPQIEELTIVLQRTRLQRYVNPVDAVTITENIDTRATVVAQLPDVNLSPDPGAEKGTFWNAINLVRKSL